eukprot:GILK01008838.1.p1 GENE.GILK01008838.1~~GILK01008838.1.p1  ORF type:complete len:487 (-),score=59.63 GILK01008838.1:172-1602(-)
MTTRLVGMLGEETEDDDDDFLLDFRRHTPKDKTDKDGAGDIECVASGVMGENENDASVFVSSADVPVLPSSGSGSDKNAPKLVKKEECNREDSALSISSLLAGVVAHVETYSEGNINSSRTISNKLKSLGASIHDRLSPHVTHLVWKEGKTVVWERASRYPHLCIVSPLWVQSCLESRARQPEANFPAHGPDAILSAQKPKHLRKRHRSMEPKEPQFDLEPDDAFFSSSQRPDHDGTEPQSPPHRGRRTRSESRSATPKSKRKREKQSKPPHEVDIHLAVSSASRDEMDLIQTAIESIGGCVVVEEAQQHTTCLVVGKQKRTLKVLFALARGTPILSMDWIVSSLQANKWIESGPYVVDTAPFERQSRSSPVQPTATESGSILNGLKVSIAGRTNPSPAVLNALISAAGGETTRTVRVSDVCLCCDKVFDGLQFAEGETAAEEVKSVPAVHVEWLFDCIATRSRLPTDCYRLTNTQ